MTDQQAQESAATIPAQANPPAPSPWADYLAAAQRLDRIRRAASTAAGEQQATVSAARQELAGVRARLAPQQARMIRDFGVPVQELTPQPAELAQAAQALTGGPAVVLAALHQARGTADAADATIIGGGPAAVRPWRPWARNLLVYGPFAAAVLIVQIILYLVASPGSVPTYALLCGLSMPVLAFGLGWATIGFVYGGEPGKLDRTPIVGAVACLTPVLLTCMGVGLVGLFR
ncbi:hypothetical protein ACWKSP_17275 [Micromonosporaceae bacterium Da 78-11]